MAKNTRIVVGSLIELMNGYGTQRRPIALAKVIGFGWNGRAKDGRSGYKYVIVKSYNNHRFYKEGTTGTTGRNGLELLSSNSEEEFE